MAATLTILSTLGGANGVTPFGGLVADANGDLFGTTEAGGLHGDGTVFEIVKTASGYGSVSTLVSFTGANGSTPYARLLIDSSGNLYGTTTAGGSSGGRGLGTVFEVAKTASGYASTPSTLVNFNFANGATPEGRLVADSSGDLFGTTTTGGASGKGTVFEIAKTASGYGPETIVASFNGTNGSMLFSGLTTDAAGDLFGTTFTGGASNKGTVFEIAKTASGYAGTPTTLITFTGSNGAYPYSGLTADAAGNLFGTTFGPGGTGATVFEIAKTASGYASSVTTLATLSSGSIYAGLIIDGKGDLFGDTYNGGANGKGSVFEVAKNGGVYASSATTIYSFSGPDGANPKAGLTADAAGDLFGSATNGGAHNSGTVFELTNTGYTPACYCPGTLIQTVDGEVAVEDLAIGDVVVTASGAEERVRWVGRRSYGGRFLAGQPHLLPVLFRAGSLGEGLPRRDLRVSPAHAMFIDGVLVPAICLVNGTTIMQDRGAERVDYVHIELAQHDVVLAEGAASETFVDDGSRLVFHNASEYGELYPDAPQPAGFCARRVEGGFELDAIRRRLADVAGSDLIAA